MIDDESKTIQLLTEIRNDQREALEISRQVLEMSRQATAPYKKIAPLLVGLVLLGMILILAVSAVGAYAILYPPTPGYEVIEGDG